jgi:glutamine amidotransferase
MTWAKPKIAIVDYGVGNLMSIKVSVERANGIPIITSDLQEALKADAIVFPGVGAFRPAMNVLEPYKNEILKAIGEGKPFLGICLGMQLYFEESLERGVTRGLGLIKGRVVSLPENVKRPHMGWNNIQIIRQGKLLQQIRDGEYFYFVHSYYAEAPANVVTAETIYGGKIPAVIEVGNLYGTQFHPEKSGVQGLKVLKNFIRVASGGKS